MATILTKRSNTASSVPVAGDLTNSTGGAELAVNTADKRLFTKDSGGTVVELGTNPSALTLPNGTANAVPYLNASKVLTTGSALTFAAGTDKVFEITGAVNNSTIYSATNGTQSVRLAISGTNLPYLGTVSNDPLVFLQNGSEQMRLTSTGLGIGTSSPGFKLDVRGEGFVGTAVNSGIRMVNAGGINYLQSGNSGAAASLHIGNWYGNGFAVLDSSGNVGIGTSSPGYKLDVSHSSFDVARFITSASNTDARINIQGNGTGLGALNSVNNGLVFQVAGTERARIDSSGNLLVGTTSNPAGAKFMVGGSSTGIYVQQATASGYNYSSNAANNGGTYYHFAWYSAGTYTGEVRASTTTTTYATSSDYRLKENIQPMTGALAKVAALKPCTYKWKADGSDGEGFIAHELAEVCPQAVTGEKDAVDADGNPVYQGIDTSFLAGLYAAAIQELLAKVNALESEINTLKGI